MRDKNIDIYRGCVMMYMTCFVHLIFWMKFFDYPYKSWVIIGSPASFMVAGAAFSLASQKKYFVYVKRRVYRIVRPYWLYAAMVLSTLTLAHFLFGIDSLPTRNEVLGWLLFSAEVKYPFICGHLWYIAPYIIISLCAPLLYKWWKRLKPHIVLVVALFLAAIFFADQFSFSKNVRYAFVYGLFYVLGFYYKNIRISRMQQVLASIVLFAVSFLLHQYGGYSINMQENKFPTNLMFTVFTLFALLTFKDVLAWGCMRLYSLKGGKWIIDIYNKYVYSIYLYQPFSFLLLYLATKKLEISHLHLSSGQYLMLFPVFFVFLIFSNAFFGMVMTKVERFLFERKKNPLTKPA